MNNETQLDFFGNTLPTAIAVLEGVVSKKTVSPKIDYSMGVNDSVLETQVIKFADIHYQKTVEADHNLYIGGRNTGQVMKNLHVVRNILVDIIGQETVDQFIKSIDFNEGHHIVPVSGGADSTGVAIIMRALFPDAPLVYVTTDTKAESPGLYYQLDLLETFLGIKINRVQAELGLYELIDKYNGFLPSADKRYCTAALKIKPLLKWMKSNFDTKTEVLINHVGIRFDEDRGGMVVEDSNIRTNMPYMKLRMGKQDVFTLLLKTIGIPSFYKWKTRSGCISCFFLRRSEKTAQLYHEPMEFMFVSTTEKLTKNDRAKYGLHWNENFRKGLFDPKIAVPYSKTRNLYPVIKSVDPRTRHLNELEMDMHINANMERIFVGVAMYAPLHTYGMCDDHLVYHQEFAVFSPKRHTLIEQMRTWYEHQSTNYTLKGFDTLAEFEEDINMICFEIEIDAELGKALKSKPEDKSFTNAKGECYAQIESITKLTNAVLVHERTKQDWETYKKFYPEGEFDPLFVSSMAGVAISIKKQLDREREAMKLLKYPGIRKAERIATPTQDEVELRQLKRGKPGKDNPEAIEVCAMCSV